MVFKKHFICKEICGALKNKSSSRKFRYDTWKLHFGTLLFAFAYINFGISIVEIKNNIQTSFKIIVSKKTSTWRLRRASG